MADLLNKKVKHSGKFGVGTVIEQDDTSITVEFPSKTCKFQYPAAFEKFLTVEDSALADVVNAELKEFKEAAEAAKAAKAAKKAAEEQAKLEALKAQAASSGKKTSDSKAYKSVQRVAGQALTYLVFQGDTYDEEMRGEFIWAPKFSKDGRTMYHWDRLMDVREGDVIFHSADGLIQAISRAKGSCIDCPRPGQNSGEWLNWENDGREVQLDYYVLKAPLKHGDYKEKILEYCNVKYAPFDKDGNGNMGYLYDLNADLAAFFIQEIAKRNPDVLDYDFLKFLLVK
jgi:conserved domain protein